MPSVKTVDDFMALYGAYYPKIYNFFFRDVFQREIAEDLTSSTFTKALQFIKTKKKEILNFNAWIYRIATNELYSYLNHQRRRRRHIIENTADEQLVDSVKDDRQGKDDFADFWLLRQAMRKLPAKEKVLLEMHFFQKMDYREMSEALGTKEVTLRSKIHRTLRKLQGWLEEEDR